MYIEIKVHSCKKEFKRYENPSVSVGILVLFWFSAQMLDRFIGEHDKKYSKYLIGTLNGYPIVIAAMVVGKIFLNLGLKILRLLSSHLLRLARSLGA